MSTPVGPRSAGGAQGPNAGKDDTGRVLLHRPLLSGVPASVGASIPLRPMAHIAPFTTPSSPRHTFLSLPYPPLDVRVRVIYVPNVVHVDAR